MPFDNLDDLRVLLAIAETGSLTAAGPRCGLGTAAVSAALKRLELALGLRLFERTTRSLRPTPEGEVVIDHARRALDLLSEGEALANAGRSQLDGAIRITASTGLAHAVLAPWLADFAVDHPRLEIDLQANDLVQDLVRDGIDVALRYGPLPGPNTVARLLVPAHRAAYASPAYLERVGEPQHPADLVRHDCITYRSHGRLLASWAFAPRHAGGPEAPCEVVVGGRLRCDSAAVASVWARQGRGISWHSQIEHRGAVARGELVPLFADQWVGAPVPLYAVLPSHRYVPVRVRVLVDALADFFAKPAPDAGPAAFRR